MKRGFTLIELLAVIVILAIIALIAVPVVVNIINDSKKESINRSIELYLDHVQKMIAKEQMKDSTFNPSECEIKPEGILECKNETKTYSPIKIEMKGQMPKSGTIKFSKGMVIEGVNLELDNLYYQVKDDKVSEGTQEKKVSYSDYITKVSDADNDGKISPGDKYTYEVMDNMEEPYTFYVLSIEGDKVNLIMNSNICNDGKPTKKCQIMWVENGTNNSGPENAMTELYNATKNWNNVPNMELTYKDENNVDSTTNGYIGITTNNGVVTIEGKNGASSTTVGTIELPLKARLPEEKDVKTLCTGGQGSCSAWLVENLKYCNVVDNKYSQNQNNGILKLTGYWLLSSGEGNSYEARKVGDCGTINTDTIDASIGIGIRPVITVLKSDLE